MLWKWWYRRSWRSNFSTRITIYLFAVLSWSIVSRCHTRMSSFRDMLLLPCWNDLPAQCMGDHRGCSGKTWHLSDQTKEKLELPCRIWYTYPEGSFSWLNIRNTHWQCPGAVVWISVSHMTDCICGTRPIVSLLGKDLPPCLSYLFNPCLLNPSRKRIYTPVFQLPSLLLYPSAQSLDVIFFFLFHFHFLFLFFYFSIFRISFFLFNWFFFPSLFLPLSLWSWILFFFYGKNKFSYTNRRVDSILFESAFQISYTSFKAI